MEATSRNNIHMVFIGRLRDSYLLISTVTNSIYQSKVNDFMNHA